MSTFTAKHRTIRIKLEAAIKSGEFAVGEQLPSEHELSQRFGVSYMTARRAVSELVAADLLERRGRKGTFVRPQTRDKLSRPTLNLITAAYEGSAQKAFLSCGMDIAQREGWRAHVIRLTYGQQDPAVRAIRNGELAIVLLDDIRPTSALGLAIRAADGRAVVLHRRLPDLRVPSILNDPDEFMLAAVKRLINAGHTRCAFVTQLVPEQGSNLQTIAWHEQICDRARQLGMSIDVLRLETPLYRSPTRSAYSIVSDFVSKHADVSGLITASDEIAIGALAACRDRGRPVPESMSVINLGDSPLLEYSSPPVTSIDSGLEHQIEITAEILKRSLAGEELSTRLYITPATLIERGSVASYFTRQM